MHLKPSKPYVIFAPHIDDEMIGCWSLLSSGLVDQVYYFNDLESNRVDEAIKLSVQYGFKAVFVDYEHELRDWFNIIKQKIAGKILLLPSIKDQHPLAPLPPGVKDPKVQFHDPGSVPFAPAICTESGRHA